MGVRHPRLRLRHSAVVAAVSPFGLPIPDNVGETIDRFEGKLDRIIELLEQVVEIESHRAWQEDAVDQTPKGV